MITQIIKPRTDDGGTGWIFENIRANNNKPMATPLPIMLAHDLLEHQNSLKAIGSIADEFEALGGVLYIRSQLRASSQLGIGYGVSHLYELWDKGVPLRAANKARKLNICAYTKEAINDAVILAEELFINNYNPEENTRSVTTAAQRKEWATYLIQSGFLKAEKRYSSIGAVGAAGLFVTVIKVLQEGFESYNSEDDVELALSYDFNKVSLRLSKECEDYAPEFYIDVPTYTHIGSAWDSSFMY